MSSTWRFSPNSRVGQSGQDAQPWWQSTSITPEILQLHTTILPLHGSGQEHVILVGSPEACFAQVEWHTLHLFPQYACGFRLLLGVAARDMSHVVLLTPSRLYEAALWESARMTVWVEEVNLSRRHAGQYFTHGRWIHGAASRIQRHWRVYWRARQRIDELDILHHFELKLQSKSLCIFDSEALLRDQWGEKAVPEEDSILLRLAVARAACEPFQTSSTFGARVFRWVECRAAAYCVRRAEEYRTELGGLAEPPDSLRALRRLTSSLVERLAPAFPWLKEEAARIKLEEDAEQAACARYVSNAVMTSADARVLRIYSAILGSVFDSIDKVLRGVWRQFEDRKLLADMEDLGCRSAVEVFASRLSLDENLPVLKLELAEVGPRLPPPLLLPYGKEENFGRAVRTACAFFGLKSVELSTSRNLGPICLERSFASLGVQGLSCTLFVTPYEPPPGSFDYALLDIVKALGSSFSLDRESKLLRLSLPDRVLLEGRDVAGVADVVILPEIYTSETQYYHFYNSIARQFTSVSCDFASFTAWLQVLNNRSQQGPAIGPDWNPEALMTELQILQHEMRRWQRDRYPCWRGPQDNFEQDDNPRNRQCVFIHSLSRGCGPADLDSLGPLLALVGLGDDPVAPATAPAAPLPENPPRTDDTDPAQARSPGSFIVESVLNGLVMSVGEVFSWESKFQKRSQGFVERLTSRDNPQCCTSADTHLEFLGLARQASDPVHGSSQSYVSYEEPAFQLLSEADVNAPSNESRGALDEDDIESQSGDAASSSSGPATTISHGVRGPEVVTATMMSAAASSAPLFTQTTSHWVLEHIPSSAMMSPQIANTPLNSGVVATGGAFTGAALGSALGPVGAGIGGAVGAMMANEAGTRILSQLTAPTPLNMPSMYELSRDLPEGSHESVFIVHKNEMANKTLGIEGVVIGAMLQASAKGIENLQRYARGELSREDVARDFLRNLRDGGALWGGAAGLIMALKAGSVGPPSVLKDVCTMALAHPSPTMFVALGIGWMAVRAIQTACGNITREQLIADVILSGSTNCIGITASLVGYVAGLGPGSQALLTMVASNTLGFYSYEAWRHAQQVAAWKALQNMAREIHGLAPDFTQERLARRWRILAKYSHPDRNLQRHGKQSFALLNMCRQVLLLENHVEESWVFQCYVSLLEKLRGMPRHDIFEGSRTFVLAQNTRRQRASPAPEPPRPVMATQPQLTR